ncbi:MAG: hypothetical protein IJX45_09730 [Spirochaetaceae bacterium]|nr:hypothetical protein [Spirochaetaceae bacterium]
MISLLNRSDGKLELDMAMGPRDFAQSRLLPFLEEDGWIVCGTSLSSWRFTEVIQRGASIHVAGSDFPGTPLLELLPSKNTSPDKNSDTSIISILKEVFRGMELIVQRQPDFQFFGTAQILVEKEKDSPKARLLFLPPTLFKRAVESRPAKEQAQLSGCYCNPQLQGAQAVAFNQGVYLYQGLSGQLPFPELEEGQRWADYRDKNFLPLEFLVPGLSSQVAASVNNNLQLGASVTAKKKNNLQDIIKDKKAAAPLAPREPVLLHSVVAAEESTLSSLSTQAESTEFIQQRESYQQQREKELRRKRFVRRYSARFKIALAVMAVGIVACISGIKDWRNEFVSTGLSPAQACGVLYTALDEQNLAMAKAMVSKTGHNEAGVREFLDRLSNFFVANRMRTGMDPTALIVTPEQWRQQPELQQQGEVWLYGLDKFNLQVDHSGISGATPEDAASLLPCYPPQRRDRAEIQSAQEETAREGQQLVAVATYDLVYSSGPDTITVESHRDQLTLEFRKGCWQVVKIRQEF